MGLKSSKPVVPVGQLKAGDVVLYRKQMAASGIALEPSVVRGVAASQRGNYFTVQKYGVSGWTNVGLVTQYDRKLYLLEGSLDGLAAFPLTKRLEYLSRQGYSVGVRQFQGTLGSHSMKTLEMATVAAFEGLSWRGHLKVMENRNNKQRDNPNTLLEKNGIGLAPIASGGTEEEEEEDEEEKEEEEERFGEHLHQPMSGATGAGVGLAEDSGDVLSGKFLKTKNLRVATGGVQQDASPLQDFQDEYVLHVLHRLQGAVQRIPPQLELEVRRAFIACDANDDGYVDPEEISKVLKDIRGKSVNKQTADSIIKIMDTDADGRVSVREFLKAFEKLPHDAVPIEHDIDALVSAESIAVLLELMGVLRRRPKSQPGALSPSPQNDTSQFVSVKTTTKRSPGTWNYFKEFGISSPTNAPIAGESEEEALLASGKKRKPHGVRGKTGLVLLPPSKEGTVALIDGTVCDLHYYQPIAFSSRHPLPLPTVVGNYSLDSVVDLGKAFKEKQQKNKRPGRCSCRRTRKGSDTIEMTSNIPVKIF